MRVPWARQNRSSTDGRSVVPTGLGLFTYAHPALKRWAKLFRAQGARALLHQEGMFAVEGNDAGPGRVPRRSHPVRRRANLSARREIFGRLSILAGNAVQIAGLVAACLALAAARSAHSTAMAVVAMVVGWVLLYFCCHAIAHWVVGRMLGIRFAYYTVGGTGNPEGWPAGLRWLFEHLPFLGVQTEKASMQRASPMARAIMWSAGVTSSAVVPTLGVLWACTRVCRGAGRFSCLRCSGRPEPCPAIGGAARETIPRRGARSAIHEIYQNPSHRIDVGHGVPGRAAQAFDDQQPSAQTDVLPEMVSNLRRRGVAAENPDRLLNALGAERCQGVPQRLAVLAWLGEIVSDEVDRHSCLPPRKEAGAGGREAGRTAESSTAGAVPTEHAWLQPGAAGVLCHSYRQVAENHQAGVRQQ